MRQASASTPSGPALPTSASVTMVTGSLNSIIACGTTSGDMGASMSTEALALTVMDVVNSTVPAPRSLHSAV